jgi:hypothetical protein
LYLQVLALDLIWCFKMSFRWLGIVKQTILWFVF